MSVTNIRLISRQAERSRLRFITRLFASKIVWPISEFSLQSQHTRHHLCFACCCEVMFVYVWRFNSAAWRLELTVYCVLLPHQLLWVSISNTLSFYISKTSYCWTHMYWDNFKESGLQITVLHFIAFVVQLKKTESCFYLFIIYM